MTKYHVQSGELDIIITARDEEELWYKLKTYLMERGPERLGLLTRYGTPKKYQYIETKALLKKIGMAQST